MFATQTVMVASGSTPIELTAGIDTDQRYTLVLRLEDPGTSTPVGVFLGGANVAEGDGFLLTNAHSTGFNLNPETTLSLQDAKVYAVSNTSETLAVDVLAYSA